MPPPFPGTGRMTAQPLKPAKRYRPGKPIVEEPSSDEDEYDDEEEQTVEEGQKKQQQQQRPPPKASSFPSTTAKQNTSGVKSVKLEEPDEDEEGFVTEEEEDKGTKVATATTVGIAPPKLATWEQTTESEEEEEEEESEEESEEEEEDFSSEGEAPRKLLRPTFIKKNQRKEISATPTINGQTPADTADEAAAKRRERTDILIRDQLEREAAARAAQKKSWDDDETAGVDESHIDDRDGLDPAAEYAAWKLRELKRVKREREAIEAAEKEREEIERRRNLTAEEREKEDREFLAKQKEEREATRGKAGFMQRYFHKGAFYQSELEKYGLDKRDLMGSRYVDEVRNREAMPEYLQLRDMTKLGRKGRTKYRDLKTEDTGRWGVDDYYRRSGPASSAARFGIKDERFLPDDRRDGGRSYGAALTGPNASEVREKARTRYRSRSPSRSRYRSTSRSHSRSRSRPRERRRSPSVSRSRSPPRRDYYRGDDRTRRKRSPSPYVDRLKRRRVDTAA
ncbi:hypothetical protein VTO42DRAFT_7838 [Malbranchea cinnamomea]